MPLSDLIAALAAATGPSRELDERMSEEVFGLADINEWWPLRKERWFGKGDWCGPAPRYTSSLDAITGAVKARWPDLDSILMIESRWGVEVRITSKNGRTFGDDSGGDSLAISLCLAAARLAATDAPAP